MLISEVFDPILLVFGPTSRMFETPALMVSVRLWQVYVVVVWLGLVVSRVFAPSVLRFERVWQVLWRFGVLSPLPPPPLSSFSFSASGLPPPLLYASECPVLCGRGGESPGVCSLVFYSFSGLSRKV